MKKRFFLLTAAFSLLISFTAFSYSEKSVSVYLNGMNLVFFDNQPYKSEDGEIYIPARELCGQIGYFVSYEEPYCVIEKANDPVDILVWTGGIGYRENGVITKVEYMKHFPEIRNSSVYIPADMLNLIGLKCFERENGNGIMIVAEETENEYEYNIDYGFELKILEEISNNKNTVISPDSLKRILALTANGTAGNTKNQLVKAIGIDDLEKYNSEAAKKKIFYNSGQYNSADYRSADSIWINGLNNELNNDFKFLAEDYYEAYVAQTDGIEEINKWVSENTVGNIQNAVNNGNFNVALIDTAYFKGIWLTPFKESDTNEGYFTNADGTSSILDFMKIDREISDRKLFMYYEEDGLQSLTLRYGNMDRGETTPYGMTFVLADKELKSDTLNRIFKNESMQNVHIEIPKFSIKSETDLTEILKGMGVSDLFSSDLADLSNMLIGEGYYVSNVNQNAFIKIDERGTEAAAMSEVDVYRSAYEPKKYSFIANRPFYYFIRNLNTGEILFEGIFAYGEKWLAYEWK